MMDLETQLKLQALLDGELPEAEQREIASLLARDPEATDLMTELRNTRQALSGFERGIRLPESREFYWSKISRQIDALQPRSAEPAVIPWWVRLRQLMVPATALALVMIAGVIATRSLHGDPVAGETETADGGALTYRDYRAQATLVWLSYPAQNEIAQNNPVVTFE
jgi:anti-sigma factor RsiW